MPKEKPKFKKIELTVHADEWPICPHCGKEIEEIRSIYAGRGVSICYCPHCRKVLGTSVLL